MQWICVYIYLNICTYKWKGCSILLIFILAFCNPSSSLSPDISNFWSAFQMGMVLIYMACGCLRENTLGSSNRTVPRRSLVGDSMKKQMVKPFLTFGGRTQCNGIAKECRRLSQWVDRNTSWPFAMTTQKKAAKWAPILKYLLIKHKNLINQWVISVLPINEGTKTHSAKGLSN